MVDIWYQILILSTVYDVTLNPFLNYKQRKHTKVPLIMVHDERIFATHVKHNYSLISLQLNVLVYMAKDQVRF
jgi:hypothetical protein